MKVKFFKWIVFLMVVIPLILFATVLMIGYVRQDAIVQSQIATLNNQFQGKIAVGDTHLAPFANFPDISIKINDVRISESKAAEAALILDVAHIYIGFNLWDLVAGNYDIHSLLVKDGFFDLVLHTDGTTNLENALATTAENTEEPPLAIHLQKIELQNLAIHQREEATNMDIGTLIYWAKGGFNSSDGQIEAHVETECELNVLQDKDTTYFKQKHFEFNTDLVYTEETGLLVFQPSSIRMEHGDFELQGSVDTKNEMTVDLAVRGTKPSFDMFIAFAPTELIPVLERYENAGDIFFNATIQGPTTNGRQPFIDARFGAAEAYLENFEVNKRIDKMGFSGHFTNGEARNLQTMEFSLTDITANLEKGNFVGNIQVKNFESPEIDMQVDANFDIPFFVGFLNLTAIKDAEGSVEMKLKFHDIIDLDNPQNALNELNQAYYAALKIEDLAFDSEELPAPLKDLDVQLEMNGKQAQLDKFNLILGNSDLSITGSLTDLPAIIHHTVAPVSATLKIKSNVLDLAELTSYSETDSLELGMNERIENLSLSLSFNALGNAFTEYTHLPKGEFFIEELYADLKQYPHRLHDFKADILVKDDDLTIVDFSGFIDESDFHFNGLIYDYSAWMQDELNGDVDFDITLKSDLLKFDNLFAYQGENYVPEEYRHEEIEGLALHLESTLHYEANTLQSLQVQLDKFEGKMHVHPLRFENFNGLFYYEDEQLRVERFTGKMGRTDFEIDMNYRLGGDETNQKKDNIFSLKSTYIDFDALSNYTLNPASQPTEKSLPTEKSADIAEHAEAFNIYQLPFPDMQFNVDIDHFVYHKLDLKDMIGQLRTTKDHYIHIDTISFKAAGGTIALNGIFNGTDPEHIFLEPNLKISNVDLDKLLFKFENFGQDVILSENLHGKLNATITGKIRVYPDFVVDLDQSEVHLDAQVLNGSLENYGPVSMLSDYFGDKDLTRIKFDTLQNHMDIINGTLSIPTMTIESTLGHMDISGTQDMNNEIDYFVRIPMSVLMKATRNKVFGTKENDPEAVDEIITVDANKRTRYLNLNIKGTLDDYDIKIGKEKK
jgi:hypothetical protein